MIYNKTSIFPKNEAISLWVSQKQICHLVWICNYISPPGLINIIFENATTKSSSVWDFSKPKKIINKQTIKCVVYENDTVVKYIILYISCCMLQMNWCNCERQNSITLWIVFLSFLSASSPRICPLGIVVAVFSRAEEPPVRADKATWFLSEN